MQDLGANKGDVSNSEVHILNMLKPKGQGLVNQRLQKPQVSSYRSTQALPTSLQQRNVEAE